MGSASQNHGYEQDERKEPDDDPLLREFHFMPCIGRTATR
jgi:hypothetical protein